MMNLVLAVLVAFYLILAVRPAYVKSKGLFMLGGLLVALAILLAAFAPMPIRGQGWGNWVFNLLSAFALVGAFLVGLVATGADVSGIAGRNRSQTDHPANPPQV